MQTPIKTALKGVFQGFGLELRRLPKNSSPYPSDFSPWEIDLVKKIKQHTIVSPEGIVTLSRAVDYIVKNEIAGAFVECGVWKGGCALTMIYTLQRLGEKSRDIYLFDTFSGMTPPCDLDITNYGEPARLRFGPDAVNKSAAEKFNISLETVRTTLNKSGYPMDSVQLIKGKVEDTLPEYAPEKICLLRLDTDFYESTRHELEHLYPHLTQKGVLIIDDYGHWMGSQKSVDEYIEKNKIPLLLNRVDYTIRMAIKPSE